MFGVAVIVVELTLYLVSRLLSWSKDKPLPGAENRLVNIAVVSLLALVAPLLILEIELTVVFRSIGDPLLTLVETAVGIALVVAIVLLVFTIIRRIERARKMTTAQK